MHDNVYTVFRRNDGHVAAIATSTEAGAAERLGPYKETSYEILLQTTEWSEARNLIDSLRQDLPLPTD